VSRLDVRLKAELEVATAEMFPSSLRRLRAALLSEERTWIRSQPLTRGVVRATGLLDMTGYVYILRCTDGRLYYGSTNDLGQRLDAHRGGRVRSTRARRPIELVYFEQHETLALARQKERAFKNGRTRRKTIELLIGRFPPEKLAPFA